MTLKSLLEKESYKVISVGKMSTEDKKELKSKLNNKSRDDDEFDEIAIKFATTVLKNNGFVRKPNEIEKALSVNEIIMALEVAGTSMMELSSVDEFDIVMIGGTDTVLRIGKGSDAVYHPISKR